MSISARLFVEDQEYNILELDLKFSQETDYIGMPIGNFQGGYFDITLETTKSPLLLQWMMNSDSMKKVKIVIPSRFGTSKSRTIELLDTYCIENRKRFSSTTAKPMTTSITLSPASMIQNGEVIFSKSWRVTDPTPKEQKPVKDNDTEKKLIIGFDAKKTDIKNGVFGFDKIPNNYKKDCKTNTALLEKEYNPIQVYGEQYFPVWVSMRKDQKITLELDFIKRKNEKLYQTIEFESHPDFSFTPTNLKDAKEVTITCNNTNPNTLQLKVLGDNDPVGAINFFYPEPKSVSLDWRYLEITGNNIDENALKRKINDIELEILLRKAFYPMLIDITLDNIQPKIVNLKKEDLNNIINKTNNYEFIIDSRKGFFRNYVEQNSIPSSTCITLYIVNRYCMSVKNAEIEDGMTSYIAGFSKVNSGVAYGILAKENKILPTAIAHEIMHALGLEHTFEDGKYIFEPKSTYNYMDYNDTKEYTYQWQWQLARNHSLLK